MHIKPNPMNCLSPQKMAQAIVDTCAVAMHDESGLSFAMAGSGSLQILQKKNDEFETYTVTFKQRHDAQPASIRRVKQPEKPTGKIYKEYKASFKITVDPDLSEGDIYSWLLAVMSSPAAECLLRPSRQLSVTAPEISLLNEV